MVYIGDFLQTFFSSASSDRGELFRFWGQKSRHGVTKYSKNTFYGLCFRNIFSIYWRIFSKLLSVVHLVTKMNWLGFGVKRSKVKDFGWRHTEI